MIRRCVLMLLCLCWLPLTRAQPADIADYLAHPAKTRIERLAARYNLVEKIISLPLPEYERTVNELGQQWRTYHDEIYPVIEQLQTKWELQCFDPIQIQLHKDQAELMRQSETVLSITLLTSMAKPALLPQVLAAYALLGATSDSAPRPENGCGRAPYEILLGLASTPQSLDENVARARDQAIAMISADGASIATMLMSSLANTARGAATVSMRASQFAKQALLLAALSYGVYEAADIAAYWQRGNNIWNEWQHGETDLQNALINSSPSLDAAARKYYLLTQRMYSYYSFDSLNSLVKVSDTDQGAILRLKYLFQNSCSTLVDERYVLTALQNQQSDDAAAILRNGGRELNMTAHDWIQQWHVEDSGKNETVDYKDMPAAEREFLHPTPKLVQFLKKQETRLKERWSSCGDGLYFLFTVADWLDAWSKLKPGAFNESPELQDAKDRIDRQLKFAYSTRESFLAISTPRPVNLIRSAWDIQSEGTQN